MTFQLGELMRSSKSGTLATRTSTARRRRGALVVGVARGITASEPTLAILLVDFDLDGDMDLFVGNDLPAYADRLYVNDGTGHL